MGDIAWYYYAAAAAFWVLVILRWRYGRKESKRVALLSATGGYLRDKTSRGGF